MPQYNQYQAAGSLTGAEKFGPVRQGPNDCTATLAQVLAYVSPVIAPEGQLWTPRLLLSGADVGMTGTFEGQFTKLGSLVFFTCNIGLSALGSSGGLATIGGLPQAPMGVPSAGPFLCAASGVSGITGNVWAFAASGVMGLYQSSGQLTNANFGNSSDIRVSGFYFAA